MEILDRLAVTFALNALWVIPALVAVAFLGVRLLGRAPAILHHSLWFLVVLYCLTYPLSSLVGAWRPPRAPGPKRPIVAAAATGTSVSTAVAPDAVEEDLWFDRLLLRPRPRVLLPLPLKIALLSWFGAASFVALGRLAAAARRTRALGRSAHPVELPETVTAAAERWRGIFGLGPVDILVSPGLAGPVTLGYRRPRILVPPSFLTHTSQAEIDAAMGHEMAHVHHRDYLVHLLFEILTVPLAFHPVLPFVRRQFVLTREMACDEAVVKSGIDARAYSRSLLALAKAMVAAPSPGHALGIFDANNLEARMKRMLNRRPRPGKLSIGLRCAAVQLILTIFLIVTSFFSIVGGSAVGA